ncbi:MAG TPA: hypothetical protein VK427_13175, partial [Kofleriaceae bacterium]|nr:hypothetical protein [Kofleriaceae bacterium]
MFTVACGDNTRATAPDASGPDATTDAAPGPSRAVVVAGDFVTPGFSGTMASLDIAAKSVDQNVAPAGAIGNDPVLRHIGSELFVVNRAAGNNVTIFDAATLVVKEQLGTGAGSNPQDVAVAGTKLFVPAMGTKGVVVLTRGSTTRDTIDLSALDPDGLPDCVSAIRVGTDIYVACGLLDGMFIPRGPGKVVVIDAATLGVRATITLTKANPFGTFTELPNNGGIVIPTFEFGNATASCLEHVSVGPTAASQGCLVQNADVGGYIVRAAVHETAT